MKKYDDCYVSEKDGIFTIGFNDDEKSVKTIENVIFIEFIAHKGDTIKEGDLLIRMEAMKGTFELRSKIEGKIIDANTEIEENPESLQENITQWLFKVRK